MSDDGIERGFVILDDRKKPWSKILFVSAEDAEATARVVMSGGYSIVAAKSVPISHNTSTTTISAVFHLVIDEVDK